MSVAPDPGRKTSELTARALEAGDKVIVATAAGDNVAATLGDDFEALQTADARTDNPHAVTKAQVGLGNVDNTSDLDKPIGTLTQTALDALATTDASTLASVGALNTTNVAALASLTVANGGTVITQGYYTASDGGANVYRYDSGSAATIDGGFVIDGPGSVGRFLAVDQTAANVRQFGAKGDGVTDDTEKVQAALDSGATAIRFTSGTYACDDLIVTTASASIRGAGATLLATTNDGEMLSLDASGVTLLGLTLDGGSAAAQGVVIGASTQNVEVVGCEIKNLAQTSGVLIVAGINVHGDGYGHVITNCYIHDLNATVGGVSRGIFASTNGAATQISRAVTVSGGRIADIAPAQDGDGIHVQDAQVASYFTIKNVSFENCYKRAIKIQADYVTVEGVSIVNDVVEAAGPLIDVYGSSVDVSSFQIYGKRAAEGIAAGTHIHEIAGVTFRGGSITLDPNETAANKYGIQFNGVVRRSTFSNIDIVGGATGVRARLYLTEALTFEGIRIAATASAVGFDFSLLDHSYLRIAGSHMTGVTYGIHINLGSSIQIIGVTGTSSSWFIRQDSVRSDLIILRPRMGAQLLGFDPGAIPDGGAEEVDVTVPGAAFGDFCKVGFQRPLQGMTLTAHVSAADTVTVRFQNESGSTVDLVAGGIYVEVESLDDRRF